MEHIELAGIHSGDSACVIPPISIPPKHIDTIYQYNRKIAVELNVVGLMNIQYAIQKDTVYILEANPRASRTVPLVSKVCNIPMARIATQIMLGKKLSDLDLGQRSIPHFGVKEAVFPFNMYHEVDPLLGPGDALDRRGAGHGGVVRAGVLQGPGGGRAAPAAGRHRADHRGRQRQAGGGRSRAGGSPSWASRIKATAGHAGVPGRQRHPRRADPQDARGPAQHRRRHHGRRDPTDHQHAARARLGKADDSYIRQTAIKHKIPYITTLAAAVAAAKGIAAHREGHAGVRSLQSYHAGIDA